MLNLMAIFVVHLHSKLFDQMSSLYVTIFSGTNHIHYRKVDLMSC